MRKNRKPGTGAGAIKHNSYFGVPMFKYLTLLLAITTTYSFADETTPPAEVSMGTEEIQFTPPAGWRFAEAGNLPKSVKVMVVGQGQSQFPPSMNLGTEEYTGNLKDYLKTIKNVNDIRHADWKDLGTIRTEAGNASLSQVDMKTQWGDVRLMHVIIMHGGMAYILTAAALKDEFPTYYKEFFKAMTSLKITKDKG